MKAGRTLQQLCAELDRQAKSKKDYIADTRRLSVAPSDSGIEMRGINGGMSLRPIAHQQLAFALGIPKSYYDRMLEKEPDLLATNVNRWLEKQPATKMVRTIDNQVRAILSDKYRALDNVDLATAVLPKLQTLDAMVISGEVTDSRFYLKAVTERITGEVKKGDVIQAGIVVSNSEVGLGVLNIQALDYRLVCLNGMISEEAIRKYHVGRRNREGADALEDAREFFRNETRQADDRAFFLKVQDATGAMFNEVKFLNRINKYKEASERTITIDPIKVVEKTAALFTMNDGEQTSVLQHLIKGGDLSAWGLANAVTRASQDVDSYDRATELEAAGGDIVEMSSQEWNAMQALPAAPRMTKAARRALGYTPETANVQ